LAQVGAHGIRERNCNIQEAALSTSPPLGSKHVLTARRSHQLDFIYLHGTSSQGEVISETLIREIGCIKQMPYLTVSAKHWWRQE
jgi:hypothetical protein